jgi:hypothetical protein
MSTIEKSPEAYEAIKGMKKEIKELAAEQKQRRLDKRQKSLKISSQLTVLHRLYLKIRNKPFEDVHKFNEHNKWWRSQFEKLYTEKWNLDAIFEKDISPISLTD